MKLGKLYGIGVGPGDPELLTLKAKRILEEIDVLLIPKSDREKRSLALSIISSVINRDWNCEEIILPMTKETEKLHEHWQQAARQIINVLKTGKNAAFITLGDPTLYSTFTYLIKYIRQLEADVDLEIVPGISAVNSISAWIQQPLAEGEESLVIVPALKDSADLELLIEQFDNIALLKAGNQVAKISAILSRQAPSGTAFLASRCGFADGFYTRDLNSIAEKKLDYLSTVIIKKGRGDDER